MSDVVLPPSAERFVDVLSHSRPDWLTYAEAQANWREALRPELERLSDSEFAAGYQDYWPIVSDPAEYLNHLWTLADGGQALTGIRIRGGDTSRPFVDAVALTQPPRGEAEAVQIAQQLAARYAAFAPQQVRFWIPEGQDMHLERLPAGSHWDFSVVAGLVAEMAKQPRPKHAERISLRPAPNLDFYPEYAREYAVLHAQNPSHAEYADAAAQEDLTDTVQAGFAFEVWLDGVRSGLAAVYRDMAFGVRGFVVQEMFLYAQARGQGLGRVVQWHLAHCLLLHSQAGDALHGTIHSSNHAALRTAAAAGRERVGRQLWVGVETAPSQT